MANTEKVAFAVDTVTVHVKRASEPGLLPDGTEAWDTVSRNMIAGESMPLSKMPPYLSEAVKKGEVPGLRCVTPAQAKKLSRQIEHGAPLFEDDIEDNSAEAKE